MFSIPHTMMQLSFLSRTTSSSYSFQPRTDWSICTCPIMLARSPRVMISSNSSLLYAMPPPLPPSVNAGRMIAGNPISSRNALASASVVTVLALGIFSPSPSTMSLNACRSSARWITCRFAPIISTPNSCSTPWSQSAHAQFNAV